MIQIHIYHVLAASTGEQLFESSQESEALKHAMEFAEALIKSEPVTMWRTFDLRPST
jgi:hypothetical protein